MREGSFKPYNEGEGKKKKCVLLKIGRSFREALPPTGEKEGVSLHSDAQREGGRERGVSLPSSDQVFFLTQENDSTSGEGSRESLLVRRSATERKRGKKKRSPILWEQKGETGQFAS